MKSPYAIEQIIVEQFMALTFWGNCEIIKEEASGRLFSKYIIASKGVASPSSGWLSQSHTFAPPKKVNLKKGESISSIVDDLGNTYYEVTSIV